MQFLLNILFFLLPNKHGIISKKKKKKKKPQKRKNKKKKIEEDVNKTKN